MQAVIFDMDGLMIDTEGVYWTITRQMAREFGKEVSEDTLSRMTGRAPLESVKLYVRETGLPWSPERVMLERNKRVLKVITEGVDPMPGLMKVLDGLALRFKLAVATSTRRDFVDLIFRGLRLHRYFSVIQTSDDIHRGKPDPETYQLAMSKLGIALGNVLSWRIRPTAPWPPSAPGPTPSRCRRSIPEARIFTSPIMSRKTCSMPSRILMKSC